MDMTLPQERGFAPGNGTLVAAVAAATGKSPLIAGKPEAALFETAARHSCVKRPLVVGDRLDTDILGGNRAGMATVLVLTGVDSVQTALAASVDERPNYLIRSLGELYEEYPAITADDGVYSCGGVAGPSLFRFVPGLVPADATLEQAPCGNPSSCVQGRDGRPGGNCCGLETADRSTVAHGTVSFLVTNGGTVSHELVILLLPADQIPGPRPVGPDAKIDEAGSLGEASNICAEGTGQGILPGASDWVTITLPPGRYELVCNLPGHYAAGMDTQLTVN